MMLVTVWLEDIEFENHYLTGLPSLPEKSFVIEDEPDPEAARFSGKYYIHDPAAPTMVEFAFEGGVPVLQQALIDDPSIDCAVRWLFIDTADGGSLCKAYSNGQEVEMKARLAVSVSRGG